MQDDHLNLFQYFCLDVISFLLFSSIITLAVAFLAAKKLGKLFHYKNKKKND
jgi:hypothetical protein